MAASVSTTEVRRAQVALDRMKSALKAFLKYRAMNDQVMAGQLPAKVSPAYAKALVQGARDSATEQRLATQLQILLSETMPDAQLPSPNLSANPDAAVQLAKIALGQAQPTTNTGMGQVPWMAVIIASALLLTITTAIKTNAESAAESERIACIQSGACTDYGFYLKWASILGVAWFAWTQMGLKEQVRGLLAKK